MRKPMFFTIAGLLFATAPVWATSDASVAPTAVALATAPNAAVTDGEVRKVDLDTKKITLKHGEIKNLGMPGMTMVFQVADPAVLERVKVGDKVRFTADKVNGAFTVTAIEAAK